MVAGHRDSPGETFGVIETRERRVGGITDVDYSEAEFLNRLIPWKDRAPAIAAIIDITTAAIAFPPRSLKQARRISLTGHRNPHTNEILRAALNESQEAFNYYDRVTARAKDPGLLDEAQKLSEMALERIRILCEAIAKTANTTP